MGFGGFYGDPNVGGQFTLAGSRKAQLIMYCLQHELWQNASIMHWVMKSANSWKRVDQYFLGQFCDIAQVAIIGNEDLVRFGYELNMALENF
jgi:hypothetical protein